MKVEFADQYQVPCIRIEEGDDFESVLDACETHGAFTILDGREYCVQFADRPQELYTRRALERSF